MRPTPLLITVVAVGGAVGTIGRYAVAQVVPATHHVPWATFLVNVVGAFLLGLLLERLLSSGTQTPRHQLARLGLGTGLLGGFTTYSALALEVHDLAAGGHPAVAAGYALGTVAAGLVACAVGVLLGAGPLRHRPSTPGTT